jgi:hypothetical protein
MGIYNNSFRFRRGRGGTLYTELETVYVILAWVSKEHLDIKRCGLFGLQLEL